MAIITGGVIEKNGKFLLVQEAREKCRGKWNIPAGHLDPGETILEAAKREVREESGCQVELTGIVQITNRIIENDIWISIVFATKLIDERIQFDPAEILDAKWFSYEELKAMREQIRNPEWVMLAIDRVRNGQITDINLLKIEEN